jgi:hypothetical protein
MLDHSLALAFELDTHPTLFQHLNPLSILFLFFQQVLYSGLETRDALNENAYH